VMNVFDDEARGKREGWYAFLDQFDAGFSFLPQKKRIEKS
jgi:hypothetical protein